MKIGISNLACKGKALREVLPVLKKASIRGIEIAPTLIWGEPVTTSKKERIYFRRLVEESGLRIIGLQSLLYKKPALQLFGTETDREDLFDYLIKLIGLCADLGGKVIVFGAAQNRRRSNLEYEKALSLAARFFHKTASVASDKGVTVCLEPLSIEYGCDFINTAEEAYDLVSLVHHNNFGLLLDTGVMALNNESAPDVIERYRDKIVHMHVNDPFLWSPGSAGIDHRLIGKALSELHYTGWISIEYENSTSSLEEVLGYVKNCYGMSSIP